MNWEVFFTVAGVFGGTILIASFIYWLGETFDAPGMFAGLLIGVLLVATILGVLA